MFWHPKNFNVCLHCWAHLNLHIHWVREASMIAFPFFSWSKTVFKSVELLLRARWGCFGFILSSIVLLMEPITTSDKSDRWVVLHNKHIKRIWCFCIILCCSFIQNFCKALSIISFWEILARYGLRIPTYWQACAYALWWVHNLRYFVYLSWEGRPCALWFFNVFSSSWLDMKL